MFGKLFFLPTAPLGSLSLWLLVGFSSQEVWVRQKEEGKIRTSTLSLLLRVWSVATSFYSRVCLSQFYWHLELSKSLLWGLVLCIAGYFTLASVP